MAKPIFTIGFPIKADTLAINAARIDLEQKLGHEYHILAYQGSELEGLTFNVLNAVNAKDIEIEELITKTNTLVTEILAKYLNEEFEKLKDEFNNQNNQSQNDTV